MIQKNKIKKEILNVLKKIISIDTSYPPGHTLEISKFIKKNTLLLIETTLPPGTFEKILIPQIKITLKKRRMKLI